MTTIYPTQIAYAPTGVGTTVGVSSVFIGRSITGTNDGIGLGQNGRPDYLNLIQINLASVAAGVPTQRGTITLSATDLVAIAGIPANLNMTLKEVTVCDSGTTKKMIVLASQLYT